MRVAYIFPILFSVFVPGVFSSVWVDLTDDLNADKFLTAKELRTVHPCGYQQCKKQCDKITDCSHVNFIRHNFTCLLMSSNNQSEMEVREGTIYHFKNNNGGLCSEIACTTPNTTCIRTKPGSNVCLKDLIQCRNRSYSVLNGTSICIKHDQTPRAWQDAKDFCESTGGRLPVIDTETVFNRMLEFVTERSISYVWLLARRDLNMAWRWENGGLVDTGEPWSVVNTALSGECLELYTQKLSSYSCNLSSSHTLCEEI